MNSTSERFCLKQLPLPAKLVVTVFLLAVGLGYFSALVQLHFQQADGGVAMPTLKNVIRAYHGGDREFQLISVLKGSVADKDDEPGWSVHAMSKAFTSRSEGWKDEVEARGDAAIRPEREAERQVVVAWLKAKAPKDAYDNNSFPLVKGYEGITEKYKDGEKNAKIYSILEDRCFVCHGLGGGKEDFRLDSWDRIDGLMHPEPEGRISNNRLAQSTHAHLLSFAMLFALTGMVFAFTTYPGWIRFVVAPGVLAAQVVDVSCWWLARLEGTPGELFASAIVFTGGAVGMGLMLQIVLSLFNMWDATGRVVLVLMFLVAGGGGYVLWTKVIDPQLQSEKKAVVKEAPAPKKE